MMDAVSFYEELLFSLNQTFLLCQNTISNEELSIVAQKVNRIQRLIEIQKQEILMYES